MDFDGNRWYSLGGSRPEAGDALRRPPLSLAVRLLCFPVSSIEYVLQGLPGQREGERMFEGSHEEKSAATMGMWTGVGVVALAIGIGGYMFEIGRASCRERWSR